MRFAFKGIASLFLASLVAGKVYFKETFDDDTWKTKWIQNEDTKKFKNFEVNINIYFLFNSFIIQKKYKKKKKKKKKKL